MKQPNNLRNRYRRLAECHRAYGWSTPVFRHFAASHHARTAYATVGGPDAEVRLVRAQRLDVYGYYVQRGQRLHVAFDDRKAFAYLQMPAGDIGERLT